MILAAALLVLVALGLFVAGLATGVTVWYWACVAVSALAAVLLFITWRQTARTSAGGRQPAPARAVTPATEPTTEPATEPTTPSTTGGSTAATVVEQETSAPAEEKPVEPDPAQASPPAAAAPAPEPEPAGSPDTADGGDPPAEDVDVTDLLLVVDMHDDVFVVDEHPRYHLADCSWLAAREAIPFPVDEARADGFTPCGVCSPDRYLAQVARARKASTP